MSEDNDDIKDIEYLDFLDEIRSDTDENDIENIKIESYYGENAWTHRGDSVIIRPDTSIKIDDKPKMTRYEKASASMLKNAKSAKESRLAIQRMAFNQNIMPLSGTIDEDRFKLLISLLVTKPARLADKYQAFINRRLTSLLSPLIPRQITMCKRTYPFVMKEHPGFMYIASKEYGNGLSFWARPDIPYFFKQNTEQSELKKAGTKENYLANIDRAVFSYHKHLITKERLELKHASVLIRNNVKTYFDLLKLNPFWFKILYDKLTNYGNENTNISNR